jgi:hypothetical protein
MPTQPARHVFDSIPGLTFRDSLRAKRALRMVRSRPLSRRRRVAAAIIANVRRAHQPVVLRHGARPVAVPS